MLKKIVTFVKQYYLFVISLIGAAAALACDLSGQDTIAHWLLILTMVIGLVPLVWGMVKDIQEGTYGVDILAAVAVITSIIMQEYWAGVVIILMLTGGESLEDYAEHRARKELDALLTRAPQKARLLRGTKEVEVAASKVTVGDKLIIRPGDVVPVDAHIIEGTTSVDESSITGESLPQPRVVGDTILSGSVNMDGAITVQALQTAANSQYEQIIKLVKAASKTKAPFVRMADRYAIPFTIIAFGIAGVAWILSGDSLRFLQVLVVATPCPLILAAPIAVISGMSRAAKQGIIIKTGSALEQLALAETFAFDKTGTLTAGKPTVDTVRTFGSFTTSDVLSYASSLEEHSNHVLAHAITEKARAAKAKLIKIKNVREIPGNGLEGRSGGKQILIGRLSMLNEQDINVPEQFNRKDIQQTAAFIAIDKQLSGIITFKDELRPEAKETLARLRQQHVKDIMMVTGDSKTTAAAVAKKLNIKTFFAEALPGDKIHALGKAQHQPIAFVGDGVNDAPVLTASSVGIALGARGSTAASQSADVVILPDSLSHVADGRMIATRTLFIARQSIFIGVGLSVILMIVFATGKFKPVYGAVIQELVDVVVIFNALRAHMSGKKN